MKRTKLDPKVFRAISADIVRMEKKHGTAAARAGMKRYLTHKHEQTRRELAIKQLRWELTELEDKVKA